MGPNVSTSNGVNTVNRRSILAGSATIIGAGLAGCLGDEDEEPQWPPERNIVDFVNQSRPGGGWYIQASVWGDNIGQHYEEDIDTTVTGVQGAAGLVAANEVWNAFPDGGTLLVSDLTGLAVAQLTDEDTDIDLTEFNPLTLTMQKPRGIQISSEYPNVDDHWDWDWDTFIDYIIEDDLTFGYTTTSQVILANMIERNEPRLNEGDISMVLYGSGSEARTSIQRGELDGYFGGFGPNFIAREEFYKTQFLVMDDRYESYVNNARDIDENVVTFGDISLDDEAAQSIVDMTSDATSIIAPPDTPDDILDIHDQAIQNAKGQPDLVEDIDRALGDPRLNYVDVTMDDAIQFASDKVSVIEDNIDLI